MNTIYTFTKRSFNKNNTFYMSIVFDNGDYVTIKGSEIINISDFVFYDRLIQNNQGVSPVAKSGVIKLKICNKNRYAGESYNKVYNSNEIEKNRKNYIENRCTKESKISKVLLYGENNWHSVVLGNIQSKMDGEFLVLEFLPDDSMGEYSSEKHFVNLSDIKKENIFSILLDFENCESFKVYNREILELNLQMSSELVWGSDDLYRKIYGGYMIVKLDECFGSHEKDFLGNKNWKLKDLEKRLCGKKGFGTHDICHLYIRYMDSYMRGGQEECVEIDDIRSEEEVEALLDEEVESGYMCYYFEGGYTKKLQDGSIVIGFGKDSKNVAKFK